MDRTTTLPLLVSIGLIVVLQIVVGHNNSFTTNPEVKRRWQHALTGHALIVVSHLVPKNMCIAALAIASLVLYYLRIYQSFLFFRIFGPLLRPSERSTQSPTLPGAFYFLVGTAVTATVFPMTIARYAVECLSLADPMAAFVGQSIASPKLSRTASLSGTLACFGTAWMIGLWYLPSTTTNDSTDTTIFGKTTDGSWTVPTTHDLIRMTVGAMACALAEALPLGNDNLTIPLVTAFAVQYVPYEQISPHWNP